MRLILDAHADLAWIALAYNRDLTETLAQINQREIGMKRVNGWSDATSCLPEMRRGGIAICLGTIFARTNRRPDSSSQEYLRTDYDFGTPSLAYAVAKGQLAYYRQLESEGSGELVRTARGYCETLGHMVRVDLGGWCVEGIAEDLDPQGCLVLRLESGVKRVLGIGAIQQTRRID